MPSPHGRVLVVDDSDAIRHLIRVNLELEGFEVVTAGDGHECLEAVHVLRPDLVTLDVVLPGLDGFRTTERLRGDARTAQLKIVMITAASQEQDKARGRHVGVDAYLVKPFDPMHLVRVVRGLLGVPGPASDGEAPDGAVPGGRTSAGSVQEATGPPSIRSTGDPGRSR